MQVLSGCCEDPVVHERITSAMYRWIEDKAPGIRSSRGCQKKILDYEPSIRMMHIYFHFFIYLWLQFLSKNSPCLGVKVLAYEYTEYITEIFED